MARAYCALGEHYPARLRVDSWELTENGTLELIDAILTMNDGTPIHSMWHEGAPISKHVLGGMDYDTATCAECDCHGYDEVIDWQ